jgi:hypothetical protein
MISYQNSDSGGTSKAVLTDEKYEISNIVETKMLYLSTKSSQCTQLNGDMKSRVSFNLRSYLDFAGDETIQTITIAMPYAILTNSNYLINSTNNTLDYIVNGATYKATFAYGNYTADTFMQTFLYLLSEISGVGFNITLDQITGKFTISHQYYSFTLLGTSTMNYIIGFSDTVVSNLTAPYPQTSFIGSIAASSNILTIGTSYNPNVTLVVGQYINVYDPNTNTNVVLQVASITSSTTYTLSSSIGSIPILNSYIFTGPNYAIYMLRVCNFLPNPLFRICIENNSIYNGQVLGKDGSASYSNVLASIPNTTKQNTQIVYQNFSDEFAITPSGQTTLTLAIVDDNNNFVDFNGISSYFQLRIRIYRRVKKSLKTFTEVLGGATSLRNLMETQSESIEKPLDKII